MKIFLKREKKVHDEWNKFNSEDSAVWRSFSEGQTLLLSVWQIHSDTAGCKWEVFANSGKY